MLTHLPLHMWIPAKCQQLQQHCHVIEGVAGLKVTWANISEEIKSELFACWCAGDEYGQTRNGCNNWYGHDTLMTRFEWDKLEEVKDTFYRFYRWDISFGLGCRPVRIIS